MSNIFGIIAVIAIIAAAGVGLYFFAYKKKASTTPVTPVTPPPPSGTWQIAFSSGMPSQMTDNGDGTFYFDFPQKPGGVHYVQKAAPVLAIGQTITLKFSISGDGKLSPVQGTSANLTLYMQRFGDNLSGVGDYQQYRYWDGGKVLSAGDFEISAPLNPDRWSDVFGKSGTDAQAGFAGCVANAAVIGFTFGDPSAGATGHGVYVDGSARFTLKEFSIA